MRVYVSTPHVTAGRARRESGRLAGVIAFGVRLSDALLCEIEAPQGVSAGSREEPRQNPINERITGGL